MTTRTAILLFVAVASAGCGRQPGEFPPPAQRTAPDRPDPGPTRPFIRMDDPQIGQYLVRDISPEKTPWPWAFAHPELRVRPDRARNLRFVMEFVVPPVTFRQTGPFHVTCFLDGKSLGPMPVPQPGPYRYERPVPDDWVRSGVPVTITAEADKKFIAKDDGAQLSFLIGAAGFPD